MRVHCNQASWRPSMITTSTPYVPTNPGIGPFFQLTVCANSFGVCVHKMNKYLPHTYILKHTKSIKRFYIHKNIRKKTKKKTKTEVMILHKIRRPNSLKIVPSGVANYRKLPFGGRAMRDSRDASSKKGIRTESPPTFI